MGVVLRRDRGRSLDPAESLEAATESAAEDDFYDIAYAQPMVPTTIASLFDAKDLIEAVAERAWDECVEPDGWPEVPDEATDDLKHRLRQLLDKWSEDHGIKPLMHGDPGREEKLDLAAYRAKADGG
ncbi:MAG: hypothetical protein AAGE52_26690 [Myxococcota bacterium]